MWEGGGEELGVGEGGVAGGGDGDLEAGEEGVEGMATFVAPVAAGEVEAVDVLGGTGV